MLGLSGFVGLPLPNVRVRVAEFKAGGVDGKKVYYDILAEGNSNATKIVPGKVRVQSTCPMLHQDVNPLSLRPV